MSGRTPRTSNSSSGRGRDRRRRGASSATRPTPPANWRADAEPLDDWMARRGVVGAGGLDTRALTTASASSGMPHGVIAHAADGRFDLDALVARARGWTGLVGADLADEASRPRAVRLGEGAWAWPDGYAAAARPRFRVVLVDYGVKRNIAALAGRRGRGGRGSCRPTTPAEAILARRPRRRPCSPTVPGDPAATAARLGARGPRAGRQRRAGVRHLPRPPDAGPGAWAASTAKMDQGHHGANHPVKDLATGKVEIVSMNHGFTVDRASLPAAPRRDPRLAVRRQQRRAGAGRPAGVLGAASPGGLARAGGFLATCSSASRQLMARAPAAAGVAPDVRHRARFRPCRGR